MAVAFKGHGVGLEVQKSTNRCDFLPLSESYQSFLSNASGGKVEIGGKCAIYAI
ncbi:hypothetical protein QF021_000577 [Acidovorax delafieldii]|uniref:hypothetical protein n=1 Tax=Acidovorax delafieldii TaxID=47920 RepID=UPI00286289C0|nr:hypothetical protein [Acidovorax delafieldii]MDR6152488.1 hypothetical protein [Acidovorax delafieldii]